MLHLSFFIAVTSHPRALGNLSRGPEVNVTAEMVRVEAFAMCQKVHIFPVGAAPGACCFAVGRRRLGDFYGNHHQYPPTMKKFLTTLALAGAIITGAQAQDVITQWNFQTVSGGVTNGTATPNIGSGTVSLIGGTTHPGFNSGSGSSDPVQAGLGYQTETYPSQSTLSGTAGVRFDLSTAGFVSPTYNGISLSFDLRTSNTSSAWWRLDYTTDGGANWTLGTATKVNNPSATGSNGDRWHNGQSMIINDLAALGNTQFGFRVVSVFSPDAFTQVNGNVSYAADTAYEVARNPSTGTTSAYSGGTWRFDMVTATAVPEPSTYAMLALAGAGFAAYRIRRRARR